MRYSYLFQLTLTLLPAFPAFAEGTSWTGAYVGAAGGTAFGSAHSDPSGTIHLGSAFGSLLAGYEYQFPSGMVVGAEGGVSPFPGLFGNATRTCSAMVCGGLPASTNFHTQVDWFADARLRAGYPFGSLLPYVTAGIGFGGASSSADTRLFGQPVAYQKIQSNLFGPIVGAGLTYAITDHLKLDALALYFTSPVNRVPHGHVETTAIRFGILWQF